MGGIEVWLLTVRERCEKLRTFQSQLDRLLGHGWRAQVPERCVKKKKRRVVEEGEVQSLGVGKDVMLEPTSTAK